MNQEGRHPAAFDGGARQHEMGYLCPQVAFQTAAKIDLARFGPPHRGKFASKRSTLRTHRHAQASRSPRRTEVRHAEAT